MPRPKKTPAQIQATREWILDTAYAILQESGPQALTSRAIAERMGVAHMSLYTYFQNQAEILRALIEQEQTRVRASLQAIARRAEDGDITCVLEEVLAFIIRYARENPNLYRLAWVTPEAGGASLEQSRQRMLGNVEQLASLLQIGMERGVFEPRDAFLAAGTVLGMVNMPFILFHSGRMADVALRERMVTEVCSAAMGYLRKK
ncbi:MAG: TetR/AcrR family transcriptional regulator [Anaerolineaceae bacterium]|nr:TetR/AcrR family transcriptional regulator [Anaerolineaceae bacterium]